MILGSIKNLARRWKLRGLEKRSLARRVNLAVIGSGKAAEYHLAALRLIGNVQVACLVNRGRTNPQALLSRYRVPVYHTSVADALENGNFEAAIIAVPPESTEDVVKQIVSAGVRCLVEKPLAMTASGAESLARADGKRWHCVGYNRRFYTSVLKARDLIHSLGAPYSMHIEAPEDMFKLLRSSGDEGLRARLVTNTTHGLDLFTMLLGKATDCAALHARRTLGGAPISFQTGSRFQNGATGTFISHWQSPGNWLVSIYGDRYKVTINLSRNQCVLQTGKTTTMFEPAVADRAAKAGIYLQNLAFLEAVANQAPAPNPLCSFSEAHDTLLLAESILRATGNFDQNR